MVGGETLFGPSILISALFATHAEDLLERAIYVYTTILLGRKIYNSRQQQCGSSRDFGGI
jgi:hypothetical protein